MEKKITEPQDTPDGSEAEEQRVVEQNPVIGELNEDAERLNGDREPVRPEPEAAEVAERPEPEAVEVVERPEPAGGDEIVVRPEPEREAVHEAVPQPKPDPFLRKALRKLLALFTRTVHTIWTTLTANWPSLCVLLLLWMGAQAALEELQATQIALTTQVNLLNAQVEAYHWKLALIDRKWLALEADLLKLKQASCWQSTFGFTCD